VAATSEGVAELVEIFGDHLAWLQANGEDHRRARRNAAMRIRWLAEELVLGELKPGMPEFDRAVDEVTARRCDPVSAARGLITKL
jgi:LAO/AO transport system kinase